MQDWIGFVREINWIGGEAGPVAAFEPASVLTAGQDMWLDLSDPETLFQDDTALSAVTTDAQSVGYVVDKAGSGLNEGRRNFQLWSEDLTKTAAWSASAVTVAADKITANGASGAHRVNSVKSHGASGTQITVTAIVEADTATHAHLLLPGSSAAWVQVRLADGVVVGSSAGSGSGLVASVEDRGGGEWRIRLTVTPLSSVLVRLFPLAAENLASTPSETSTASMFVRGIQVEFAGAPTAYQATEGGWSDGFDMRAVSNKGVYVADAVNGLPALQFTAASAQQMSGTRFGLTRNRAALHIFAVMKLDVDGSSHRPFSVAASGGTRFDIGTNSSNQPMLRGYLPDGSLQASILVGHETFADWSIYEAILDYENDALSAFINGAEGGVDADAYASAAASPDSDETSILLGNATNGMIATLIVRSGVLTETQRQNMLGYLADRFAITARPYNLEGAWTWFSDARAIQAGGMAILGSVHFPSGDVRVSAYGSFQHRPVMLHAALEADDHDNPALLRRSSDGRILAGYSGHDADSSYIRVSTSANSVAAFGAEQDLDDTLEHSTYTYSNLIEMPAEGKIYNFLRLNNGVGRCFHFTTSSDNGETWSSAIALTDPSAMSRPYFRFVANGSRIDFITTDGHPGEVVGNSIYHGYIEGGLPHDSAGNEKIWPLTPSTDLTQIWDGSTEDGEGWVWDIAIDGNGRPVVVYAVFPTETDHRYRYAKWNGTSWDDNEIAAAGQYLYAAEPNYSGGVCIDPADINQVFASIEVVDDVHQIHRCTTEDDGATWSVEQITDYPDVCFRPYVIAGRSSEPRLAFVTGTYTSFINFATRVTMINSDTAAIA